MKKWEECVLLEGKDALLEHFANKKLLLIMGMGFDPRACHIAEHLIRSINDITIYVIDYNDVGIHDKKSRYEENIKRLQDISKEYNVPFFQFDMPMYKKDGLKKTLIISESVRTKINRECIIGFSNILIDISAMPKGVSFSLINRLIKIKDIQQKMSITVCENSMYDDSIISQIGEETAEFLPGFRTFSFTMEQNDHETVWFPILGMDDSKALRIIANYLKPIEICPIIPFPAVDVRRGEKMLRSCGEVLFRERAVEKRNIIYVPENDPRLVCQKIFLTVKYYEKAFGTNPDRNIQYVFSSSSSKLIDVGLLLAIISLSSEEDIETGIVILDKQGYSPLQEYHEENEKVFCLCLDENYFEW